jgi:hypothetical protein
VDILFLGQNDLCMSMGLYEKYEFPHMYTSPELGAATQKLVEHARKNNVILGRYFSSGRIPREGVHVYQHRQRSAPRADAGRSLCTGHRGYCERKGEGLDSSANRTSLIAQS